LIIMSTKTTAPKPLNVLVVGGGMISAEVILPTVFQARRIGLVGGVGVASRRAQTVLDLRRLFPAEEFAGWPADKDAQASHPDCYKEAIKKLKHPGCVIVATPDHLHTPVILDALATGLDVIVQKPLCLKVAEAHEIAAAAAKANCYVYTDYHKRHDKAVRAAKYKYSTGELGEALCGHAWIEERREMPLKVFGRWADQSSSFEYIGCHYVDAFHFITGLKPRRVAAFRQHKLLKRLGHAAWDAVQAVVEWENDAVFYVQTSWVLPDSNPNLTNQGFQLTCTQGEYRADNADRNSNFVTQSGGVQRFNPHFFKPYNDWDEPAKTEWVGYGGDSILQPLQDIQRLCGVSAAERRWLIAQFEKTRPLPQQALIATAVNEAVRLSVTRGSRFVVFDGRMRPRLEN
jgi:predicted dehydrogenase